MEHLTHLTGFLSLDNQYVLQTLFAVSCLLLGMLGMIVGQRLATNGRLCMLIGAAIGIGTMSLLATPFAFLAPGWLIVFVVGFLAYNELTKIIARGHKKDPAKTDK